MALVWAYNGLWLKILAVDPHHAQIAETALGPGPWLALIGAAEFALALALASGRMSRLVNVLQIVGLAAMNGVGILSGQIERPVGLLISNLPFVGCAMVIVLFGPGRWVFPTFRRR